MPQKFIPKSSPRSLSDGVERFIVAGGGYDADTIPMEIYNAADNRWDVLPMLGRKFAMAFSWVHNGNTFFMAGGNVPGKEGDILYLSLRGLENGGDLKQTEWRVYPEKVSATLQKSGNLNIIP